MTRRGGGAQLITIFWRDIPAQVTARAGREKASVQLPDRFQVAIDQAATRAGKTTTDAYLAEWREERAPCGPDLEEAVENRAAEIEASYTEETLTTLVQGQGWAG